MPERPLYFVQISDTHLGNRESYRRTQNVIDHINKLPIEIACVVHTGDIMDYNILDAAKVRKAVDLFGQLRWPIHYIPGNHDILPAELERYEAAYRQHFGELSSRVEYGGVVFLFIDSSRVVQDAPATVIQRTFDAVEHQLQAAPGKPVLLFQHEPSIPFVQPRRSTFVGGWPEQPARAWEQLLNAYHVKAVIAGHCHQNIHAWLGDVPLYVSPSVIFGKPDCRLFEYRNGKLTCWTMHVEPPKALRARLRDKLRAYMRHLRGDPAPHRETPVEVRRDLAQVRQ